MQIEALDALDALCEDDRVRLDMRLEPGDVQWLHNHTTFHAEAYSCETRDWRGAGDTCFACGSRRPTRDRSRRCSRRGSGRWRWVQIGEGSGSRDRSRTARWSPARERDARGDARGSRPAQTTGRRLGLGRPGVSAWIRGGREATRRDAADRREIEKPPTVLAY